MKGITVSTYLLFFSLFFFHYLYLLVLGRLNKVLKFALSPFRLKGLGYAAQKYPNGVCHDNQIEETVNIKYTNILMSTFGKQILCSI